ncbi:MAG: tetratricopeptide repeat protein [Candidatus Omnitrophica bacterium]|nr:tetratricopeptide repeat protein [Candidatus Omnitrophota bacterium]
MIGGALLLSTPAVALDKSEKSQGISIEEFQASPFAASFQAGDLEAALKGLEPLLARYPKDPLLLRYRAITLDRLGRSREAIAQFREVLKSDPRHLPTRYFLGQAYARAGETQRAVEEWEWVLRHSEGAPYRDWAQAALERFRPLLGGGTFLRRWFLRGSAGWEWDSNVTLKPGEKALAVAGDRNADRFSLNLQTGYRAIRRRNRVLDLLYTARQSFHDDDLDDLNFTSQELALDGYRKTSFAGHDLWAEGRYDLIFGFLEGNLFSASNRVTFSADARLSPRTRTVLTNRLEWANFGPDGSNPPQTSRDGLYEEVEAAQYLYTADLRRYLVLSQGYRDARTRGGNFESRGTATRVGLHTPVTRRVEADLAVGFLRNRYPRFSSLSNLDQRRRLDTQWDFFVGLTVPLHPRLVSQIFWRFIRAKNRNDFFEYDRHLAGVELLF